MEIACCLRLVKHFPDLDPACPVGWFEEETWRKDGKGYHDGVFTLTSSLDELARTLVTLDKADYETETATAEMIWMILASGLE